MREIEKVKVLPSRGKGKFSVAIFVPSYVVVVHKFWILYNMDENNF